MNKKIVFLGLMICVLSVKAKVPKQSWILFKPHVYLGVGGVKTLSENPPPFIAKNDADLTYETLNSLKSKGLSFQSQIRLSFIEVGSFSLGYSFWNHQHEYEADLPELWYASETPKPFRYNLSFHAACLQMNSPWQFANNHISPFIVGGVGPFYGSTKDAIYTLDEYTGWLWMNVYETVKYDGWAWMAGAGTVIYKYAYFYTGVTYFLPDDLPGHVFLDIIVGVRL